MKKKHAPGGTAALLALQDAGLTYTIHHYEHDPRSKEGFGLEGAHALGVDPARVFKTLMVQLDGHLTCAVVPAAGRLNLKAFAQALAGKHAELADPASAARATGYVIGGISPLGQKRPHATVIDISAQDFDTILVSGGQRGMSIELAASDLADICGASFAAIGR